MATRAGVSTEELKLFKEGTRFFTLEDNLEAFSPGDSMVHLPYAAQVMANFMVDVGFIPEVPDMSTLFDDRFVRTRAEQE